MARLDKLEARGIVADHVQVVLDPDGITLGIVATAPGEPSPVVTAINTAMAAGLATELLRACRDAQALRPDPALAPVLGPPVTCDAIGGSLATQPGALVLTLRFGSYRLAVELDAPTARKAAAAMTAAAAALDAQGGPATPPA